METRAGIFGARGADFGSEKNRKAFQRYSPPRFGQARVETLSLFCARLAVFVGRLPLYSFGVPDKFDERGYVGVLARFLLDRFNVDDEADIRTVRPFVALTAAPLAGSAILKPGTISIASRSAKPRSLVGPEGILKCSLRSSSLRKASRKYL